MKRALAMYTRYEMSASGSRRKFSTEAGEVACIVGAARTPLGAFQGLLSSVSATELGSIAIRGAVQRSGIDPASVDEVFMGNVISSNLGQAPARQASLGAGLPLSAPCTAVNRVCSSGLKAVMLGALTIQAGLNEVVVAGGMESMSNAPYYLPKGRTGYRMGHGELVDGLLRDGLWDAYNDIHMGECAERCAAEHSISRAQQDAHAVESARRAMEAAASGMTAREIVPVEVRHPKSKQAVVVDADESLARFDASRVPHLRPAFRSSDGSVTAGNSSVISDGAAAVVMVSQARAQQLGLKVLARVVGQSDAAQDPTLFTTAPTLAVRKLLANAGLGVNDIDLFEINEAFSVVDIVNRKLLGIPDDRVNVAGGAVALGHPIGASGARLLVTLLNLLEQRDARRGVVAICNGGGGATAILLDRSHSNDADRGRL